MRATDTRVLFSNHGSCQFVMTCHKRRTLRNRRTQELRIRALWVRRNFTSTWWVSGRTYNRRIQVSSLTLQWSHAAFSVFQIDSPIPHGIALASVHCFYNRTLYVKRCRPLKHANTAQDIAWQDRDTFTCLWFNHKLLERAGCVFVFRVYCLFSLWMLTLNTATGQQLVGRFSK